VIIALPLVVIIPRKTKENKTFALNLNIYRNSHHMTLNQAKELYGQIVKARIGARSKWYPPTPPLLFTYTVYPANNRKFDLANVLPIVQKFTDDALIEWGVIPDDCYKVIPAINYRFGGVDKESPRVELEITEWRK
jgi:hypothetical protein